MKNVITFVLSPPPSPPFYFVFENLIAHKYTRNELACLVMGTIFLVICLANRKCSRNAPGICTSHSNAHEQ